MIYIKHIYSKLDCGYIYEIDEKVPFWLGRCVYQKSNEGDWIKYHSQPSFVRVHKDMFINNENETYIIYDSMESLIADNIEELL
jgi:hypothetical protein